MQRMRIRCNIMSHLAYFIQDFVEPLSFFFLQIVNLRRYFVSRERYVVICLLSFLKLNFYRKIRASMCIKSNLHTYIYVHPNYGFFQIKYSNDYTSNQIKNISKIKILERDWCYTNFITFRTDSLNIYRVYKRFTDASASVYISIIYRDSVTQSRKIDFNHLASREERYICR